MQRTARQSWSARPIGVVLALVVVGCSDSGQRSGDAGGDGPVSTPARFAVDPQVKPTQATIPALDPGGAARTAAAVIGPSGVQTDFVANELIVVAAETSVAQGIADRFRGKISRTVDPAKAGATGQPKIFLLTIDPRAADPAELGRLLAKAQPAFKGEFKVSSSDGLGTLAAGASAAQTAKVSPNWIQLSAGIAERSTQEGPTGEGAYETNAFNWPYMKRGGNQNFGVAEAWRMLHIADRLKNKVDLAVFDGGFKRSPDFLCAPGVTTCLGPSGSIRILPDDAWDRPNPATCSGGLACPFHGTMVATAAFGVVNNGFGAAGSGGPVAAPLLVASPAPDFFAWVHYIFDVLPGALRGTGSRVVNISAGTGIDGGFCFFGICDAIHDIGRALRAANILVVAAAGNDGVDVDKEDCTLGSCWEGSFIIPCEVEGVLCVGGVGWDSDVRAVGSNHGYKGGNGSVSIYGPYTMWVGPDPAVDIAANTSVLRSGTSFASPFVAGVAALVMAAKPSLKPAEVTQILLETATTSSASNRVLLVNAYEAVRRALGGNAPPFVKIAAPASGSTYKVGDKVSLRAEADDDGTTITVRWFSDKDGELGTGQIFDTLKLSQNAHQITARASDGTWEVSSAPITLTVGWVNQEPVMTILEPQASSHKLCCPTSPTPSCPTTCANPLESCNGVGWCIRTYFLNQTITLSGTSSDDLQPGTFGPLPDSAVQWIRLDPLTSTWVPLVAGKHTATVAASALGLGTHVIRFKGQDSAGIGGEATHYGVIILPAPTNNPPTATITSHPLSSVYDLGYADKLDAVGWYKEVTVSGTATDPEDGAIPASKLTWSVKRDQDPAAAAGGGASVTLKLYPKGVMNSNFAVTLTAKDSQGAAGAKLANFTARIFQ